MRSFMGQGSVITVCVTEALEGRKLDCIIAVALESAVSAVVNGYASRCEKLLGVFDAGAKNFSACSMRARGSSCGSATA